MADELIAEQMRLAPLVVREDDEASGVESLCVGGLDVSFSKTDKTKGVAMLVCLRWSEAGGMETVHEDSTPVAADAAYTPGLLAQREVPAFQILVERAPAAVDYFIVDGNGILHPRRCGSASMLGVLTGRRTIGVAKSLLRIGQAGPEQLGYGEHSFVRSGQEVVGAALRTAKGAVKPVFVSVGHRVSLERALAVVLAFSLYRIPEPQRQADIRSRVLAAKC